MTGQHLGDPAMRPHRSDDTVSAAGDLAGALAGDVEEAHLNDLRHAGLTLAALSGAMLRELMAARGGHDGPCSSTGERAADPFSQVSGPSRGWS